MEDDIEYKEAYVFGHKFRDLPGNIDDLVTLEREGCIYSHFWDELSQTFKYYKIKFTPVEIFQYVEAHIAKSQFDAALEKGLSFKKALSAIENEEIAQRVLSYGNYGKTQMKDGTFDDIRGCLGSFFPPDIEKLVCGNKHERYENVFEIDKVDKIDLIYNQLDQFPIIAKFLSNRKHNRHSYIIENEYDVQDLLFVCLKSVFDDIRLEEWTIKHGTKSKRIDIVIPTVDTVIEVKYVRSKQHANEITDELKIDFESYHVHPNCKTLICFVYDPKGFIIDSDIIAKELSGRRVNKKSQFEVKVFIRI
jgi:hypothetical protein